MTTRTGATKRRFRPSIQTRQTDRSGPGRIRLAGRITRDPARHHSGSGPPSLGVRPARLPARLTVRHDTAKTRFGRRRGRRRRGAAARGRLSAASRVRRARNCGPDDKHNNNNHNKNKNKKNDDDNNNDNDNNDDNNDDNDNK